MRGAAAPQRAPLHRSCAPPRRRPRRERERHEGLIRHRPRRRARRHRHGRDDGGLERHGRHQPVRDPDRARRHARRHHRRHQLRRRSRASRRSTRRRFMPAERRPRRPRQGARRLRRAGAPRRPAGARRAARRRSRTRTRARACSSSSTAPTPTSSPRSSRRRTTACASATPRARSRFEKAGGFAPTMGIIGTVFGLVHVLENLDAPVDARPVDLRRVHRDAARRRVGEHRLPPDRPTGCKQLSAEEELQLPRDDARGHPRDPGGRQPARRRRRS